jgi:Glyoxalase/Bleomycin resistance protein/Dioxygenase superfamily
MSPARPASGLFADPRPVEALGDLFANIWQICWVTSDFDRGVELLDDRFGIEHFTELPTDVATFLKGEEPVDCEVRLGMGARGGMIVELIEPVAGEVDFYRRALPQDGSFGMRLHHLASFVPLGDDVWESIGDLLAAQGKRFEHTVLIPDRVRAGYVDMTEELGHFLEICQLQPADTEFFSGLIEQSA